MKFINKRLFTICMGFGARYVVRVCIHVMPLTFIFHIFIWFLVLQSRKNCSAFVDRCIHSVSKSFLFCFFSSFLGGDGFDNRRRRPLMKFWPIKCFKCNFQELAFKTTPAFPILVRRDAWIKQKHSKLINEKNSKLLDKSKTRRQRRKRNGCECSQSVWAKALQHV